MISHFAVNSDGTKRLALDAARRRNGETQLQKNAVEIEYHRKHGDH
jgi:hypothetical protein